MRFVPCWLFCFLSFYVSVLCAQQKPNIILINLDDADSAALAPSQTQTFFPNMNRLATDGVRFTNVHVTTPLCGPSRCCLLRAQYAHNTRFTVNDSINPKNNGMQGGHRFYFENEFEKDDLSTWMQSAGYRTMIVGKYLNNDVVNGVPAGWDDYYTSRGNKYYLTNRYTTREFDNGRYEQLAPGKYRTTAEGEDVIELINRQVTARSEQPFFVYWNPLAPHRTNDVNGMIETQMYNWWQTLRVPRVANFDEPNFGDKRGNLWMLPRLTDSFTEFVDGHYRERVLSLRSFDNILGRVLRELDELGISDNTYVILTSDNGWLEGHHRLNGKAVPYEKATKVPLFVRGPGISPATRNHLIAHIDIGPTIVKLASGIYPDWVDGQSFLRLLFEDDIPEPTWREPILIENWTAIGARGLPDPVDVLSTSLRFYDSTYIEWFNGDEEYYDLESDPHQLQNIYDSLPNTEKNELASRIRQIKSPTIPRVGIIEPFGENDRVSRKFVLRGIAEDDDGIRAVKATIFDKQTRHFWNGVHWQQQFVQLFTELSNPYGQTTKWQLPIDIPSDKAYERPLQVQIWPVDASGNFDRNIKRDFKLDVTPPISNITFPSQHQRVGRPTILRGTTEDDSEIESLRVVIRNRDNNQFWSGSQLGLNWNFFNVIPDAEGNWEAPVSLPAGRYVMTIRGIDEHGNYPTTVSPRFFIVN